MENPRHTHILMVPVTEWNEWTNQKKEVELFMTFGFAYIISPQLIHDVTVKEFLVFWFVGDIGVSL